MEMFLMALCLSLLGVAVCAALFIAATVDERRQEASAATAADRPFVVAAQPQFFAAPPPPPVLGSPGGIPIEVLLLRLEQHVRLEQAAAESFHDYPTSESLHMRTSSPLVH